VAGVLLLAYKYFSHGIDEALIVNANLGGDNCHRGALLGAILGAAGLSLSEELRTGLYDPASKRAAALERYLEVVQKTAGGSTGVGTVVQSLAPRPAEAVASAASECKT